uniref:DNA-directed DNA polymerase n=1 Tax=Craspedacusta sowerbii TaxID=128124 RepID=A0A8F6U2Q5_CRASO|nr:putative family B DNA polymerase [Craspedacusta sowerbii]
MTLDIETYIIKGVHSPFAASICEIQGLNKKSLIQTCHKSPHLLLESLFLRCFFHFGGSRFVFYCHNLGRFEGPLLTNFFIAHRECRIENLLIHENKIIMLHVRFRKNQLVFKDSLNFLPYKLHELNTMLLPKKIKEPLPFNPFLNKSEKFRVIPYVKHDAQILATLLHIFKEQTYSNFLQDPLISFGIPGIALNIYTKFFYQKGIFTKERETVRKSFRGGLNFIKQSHVKRVMGFDVNSLYPFCMLNRLPIGEPKLKKKVTLEDFFGFVYVKSLKKVNKGASVTANDSNYTLPPSPPYEEKLLSSVPMILFSEEAKYAQKLGYVIEVGWGVQYESSFSVFHKFVNYFYNLKKSNHSMNSISGKLIMNSLYGRLGMRENYPSYQIIDRYDLHDLSSQGKNVKLIRSFSANAHLIENREDSRHNRTLISTPIASAIASYGRMTIHQWVTKKDLKTHYSDTDSLYILSPPAKEFVSDNLGGLKMINPSHWEEAIFIKSKMYGLRKREYSINKIKSIRYAKWEHLTELQREKKINLFQQRWFMRKNHVLTLIQGIRLQG